MSFNTCLPEDYLIKLEVFQLLMKRFISLRNAANTVEEKALIESQAVELLKQIDALDFQQREVHAGDYPVTEEIYEAYGESETLFTVAVTKLRKLVEIFLKHYNLTTSQIEAIVGKKNRIKQKLATLTIQEAAKYVLTEGFKNLDSIATNFVSAQAMTVQNGILTLPRRSTKILDVKALSIGAASTGVPGNSDSAVTFNNTDLNSILASDDNQWFEYERLDSGPLALNLVVELQKEEIVNSLSIKPINLGLSVAGTVEDITFTSSSGTQSLKTLLAGVDQDFWDVPALGTDWEVVFPPLNVKTIVIKLVQDQSYEIETAGGERDRFALGLRHIDVSRITFSVSGAINSVGLALPGNLYLGQAFIKVIPDESSLFDLQLDVSLDGGSKWVSGREFFLQGEESTLYWRLACIRNDSAIAQVSSFYPSTAQRDVGFVLKPVSVTNSPANISLPEKPHSSDIYVMQPKVGRRGLRNKKIRIGTGTGTNTSIHLPFDILNIDPEDLSVFVDGREYSRNEDNGYIGPNEWAYSDDFTELEFSSSLPSGSIVEVVIAQEIMEFELKADGYYHTPELLFDPDKDSIDIQVLASTFSRVSVVLPRDKKLIQLGYKNIAGGLQFTSTLGLTYTEVTSRTDVASTASSYYLDAPNGILWLNAPIGADTVRVSFGCRNSTTLSSQDFDILYEGSVPKQVRIPVDKFTSIAYEDVIGEDLQSVIDLKTGVYGPRSVFTASDKVKTLSSSRVIKGTVTLKDVFENPSEVDYIDGISEFFGLTHVEDEKTISIVASGSTVQFNLSAGAYWFSDLDVQFSNTVYFGTKTVSELGVNAPGEYYISAEGEVTVYVGPSGTLPADIEMSYYYRDPNFNSSEKFSVDYRNGIVYTYTEMTTGSILYQSSAYTMGYDIAREMKSYSYNSSTNAVSIRTEHMHKVNALVKIFWQKADEDSTLSSMVDYFSPVIDAIGWRFN